MSLTEEWPSRINLWREELKRHFYTPLGELDLEVFFTFEQLTLQQVRKAAFRPIKPGTRWGKKWEYGWFRGTVKVPSHAAGHRIVVKPEVDAEGIVFVNGDPAGAFDQQHREICLTRTAVAGTIYKVIVEGYAWHGPAICHVGPVPLDRVAIPEPPAAQKMIGTSSFGIWHDDVYQLWADVDTLWSNRTTVDENSLRRAEIDAGLRDFTCIVEFEAGSDVLHATVAKARARLKPLLACINGSTSPLMFAFGHGHLDVEWLWPLQETNRKFIRTMSNQLALAKDHPEHVFLQSTPYLYNMAKEKYPEFYTRIKQAVKRGTIIPEGGMWVEADTNLAGGEALIRQFIHGKQFFREEFGVDNRLLWLPDVFGYNAQLPQIMQGCGIEFFATAKILWAYNANEKFPHTAFWWEGLDGTRVPTYLLSGYGEGTHPEIVADIWNHRHQKDGLSTAMLAYGYGDGGGGPTRDHMAWLQRVKNLEGVPRVQVAGPVEFFDDLMKRGMPNVSYVGELYFTAHRGTFTSQARTKKGNRMCETALREAEMWLCAAQALKHVAPPLLRLRELWRTMLEKQFHDVLPGSSINRVYQECEEAHAAIIGEARDLASQAAGHLAKPAKGSVTVFNSLSWERDALVQLPPTAISALSADGTELTIQTIDGTPYARTTVSACGWTTVRAGISRRKAFGEDASTPVMSVTASRTSLENDVVRITLSDRGEITSFQDKQTGHDLAAGPCNQFRMYKDVPAQFDAWDIDRSYALNPVELPGKATATVVTQGPLMAIVRVVRTLNKSHLMQDIVLRPGARRVDFVTRIDWHERHKLLKVAFPLNVHASEALCDTQFGFVKRANHLSRPHDVDRFEVCNHKWTALTESARGAAVINDCKYGVNVLGNTISLSLLRAPLAPDMTADQGMQVFTYSLFAWDGPFAESELVRQAYDVNIPCITAPGSAGHGQMLSVDAPNIVVEAIKPAEDGSGDVVVRLYESMQMRTRCTLSTPLPVFKALLTNMLEENGRVVPAKKGRIALEFRPFEIKTVRLVVR